LNWLCLFLVAGGLFAAGYFIILGMLGWSIVVSALGLTGICFYAVYDRYVL